MTTPYSHLKVSAAVRYWEDAKVNLTEDTRGTLIPCRNRDLWEPLIDLTTGQILGWPKGVKADVHYKICDAGEYWLTDADGKPLYKWRGHYVPNDLLAWQEDGYGDYIILDINESGIIQNWNPCIDLEEWKACAETAVPTS